MENDDVAAYDVALGGAGFAIREMTQDIALIGFLYIQGACRCIGNSWRFFFLAVWKAALFPSFLWRASEVPIWVERGREEEKEEEEEGSPPFFLATKVARRRHKTDKLNI